MSKVLLSAVSVRGAVQVGVGAPVVVTARVLVGVLCVFVALVGVGVLGAVGAASAVAQGQVSGRGFLPEGRGWELVSPVNANGSIVRGGIVSKDGQRVLYAPNGGLPIDGLPSGSELKPLLAERGATGWVTRNILPPLVEAPNNGWFTGFADESLTRFVALNQKVGAGADANYPESIWRLSAVGGPEKVFELPPTAFTRFPQAFVASDDTSHIFGLNSSSLDPARPWDDSSSVFQLYDYGSGTAQLVGLLPGGVVPSCGIETLRGFPRTEGTVLNDRGWVSADGARVFFGSVGDVADCSPVTNPPGLYVREGGPAGTTRRLDVVPSGEVDRGAVFLGAVRDGSSALFVSATNLVAGDTDNDYDIYRLRVGSGIDCVTCAFGADRAIEYDTGNGGVPSAIASADGRRVYFTSPNQLAAGASAYGPGDPVTNMYVADTETHELRFVSVTDHFALLLSGDWSSAMTPDGSVMVFTTRQSITSDQSAGFLQYYRYDDRAVGADRLVCISCPAGSAPAQDVDPVLRADVGRSSMNLPGRLLSDDGRTFLFRSVDPLVAGDHNTARLGQDPDVGTDIYEWRDGQRSLITDGETSYGDRDALLPVPQAVTPSGDDLLFTTAANLTGEPIDAANSLYTARVGGGFAPAPVPASKCEGDACQGVSSVAPSLSAPSSSTFVAAPERALAAKPGFSVRPISAGDRRRLEKTGKLTLEVRVTGAGTVAVTASARVRGRLVRVGSQSKRVAGPQTVSMPLTLARAARQQLARARRLPLRITTTFTGVSRSTTVSMTLTAPQVPQSRKGK